MIKSLLHRLGRAYAQKVCQAEFRSQQFYRFNERPIEFSFVFRKLGELYPRTILDVGTGTTALPHLMRNCGMVVTATDNVKDYWPMGMTNRHYHIIDDDITNSKLGHKYDMVTCISVLEHIEDAESAVRNMLSLLEPNGHLLMTFPYNETSYIRNVYELPRSSYGQDAAYITQSFSRSEINSWLTNFNGQIQDQEFWQFWEGDHWTVGKQQIPPRKVGSNEKHQLTCLHIANSN